MKKQFLCFVFAFVISCTPLPKKNNETLKTIEYNFEGNQIIKWKELEVFVGES